MLRSIRIRTVRTVGVSVLLALAPLAVGCGGTSATEAPAVTAVGATAAPVAIATHGRVKRLGDALAQVPLRPDQRTEIEQLASDAEARQTTSRAAHVAVMSALADQIEQGKIDRVALQPKIDVATAAFLQSRPKDHAAFERLHAILDTTQRGAFVDALEANAQEHRAHGSRGDKLEEWATALKLTDDQKDQIHAALRDQFMAHKAEAMEGRGEWKKAHDHGKKMLEGFRADQFAMSDFVPAPDVATKADRMADHFVHIAEVVLPLLTAEQRTLAAAKLRAHAADPSAEMEQ
jgi:hypothetical protein